MLLQFAFSSQELFPVHSSISKLYGNMRNENVLFCLRFQFNNKYWTKVYDFGIQIVNTPNEKCAQFHCYIINIHENTAILCYYSTNLCCQYKFLLSQWKFVLSHFVGKKPSMHGKNKYGGKSSANSGNWFRWNLKGILPWYLPVKCPLTKLEESWCPNFKY